MKVYISNNEVEIVTADGSSIWVPILEYDYDLFMDMQELYIDDESDR